MLCETWEAFEVDKNFDETVRPYWGEYWFNVWYTFAACVILPSSNGPNPLANRLLRAMNFCDYEKANHIYSLMEERFPSIGEQCSRGVFMTVMSIIQYLADPSAFDRNSARADTSTDELIDGWLPSADQIQKYDQEWAFYKSGLLGVASLAGTALVEMGKFEEAKDVAQRGIDNEPIKVQSLHKLVSTSTAA